MRLDESSGGLHIAVSAKQKKTGLRLKRGIFSSIVELQTAINRFIAEANQNPKPFVWTKSAKRHPRRCPARDKH